MHLKRLEIVGFKSFIERTPVSFSKGISAVVGPNGCGKSNIIDAIRWVMGEQSPRLLRTRNMEDLLFNGSVGRPRASVAEVNLTLATGEEKAQSEITVTRRLYRGGDSEYLINRSPSRLKDLVRFFIESGMGTRAYNIIEQEKVGRLVDAPPEERRLLIDEAAGITRFKEQKKEAEKRLVSAEQNLETVQTLLNESGKRLTAVTKAAAKANKYQAIKNELKELELVLSSKKFLVFSKARERLVTQVSDRKNELALAEAKNAETEIVVDNLRLSESSLNQELETELNGFHQMKSRSDKMAMEIDHLTSDREGALQNRESALDDLSGLDDEYENQAQEKERLETELTKVKAENAEAEETRKKLRESYLIVKAQIDKLTENKNVALKNLEEAGDYQRRLGETLAGAESLAEHLKGRRRDLELEGNQADMTLNEAKERLASRERFKKTIEEDLKTARENMDALRKARDLAKNSLEDEVKNFGEADKKLAGLSSRLDTLEAFKEGGFGWYPEGAVALMKDPEAKGLIAPVAESLKIPDGYEEAAEAALGDKLGWIVVDDRRAALEALTLAREKGLGRCGFVSKKDLNGQDLAQALLGPVELRPAVDDDMLESPSPFLTLEGDYFGQTLMAGGGAPKANGAPAATTQSQAHKPNHKHKNKGGAFGGGHGQPQKQSPNALGQNNPPQKPSPKQTGLLARVKELEALRVEVEGAENELRAIEARVSEKRQTLKTAEEELSAAGNQLNAFSEDLNAATSKILVASSEVKGLEIRRDSLAGEIERNQTEMAACEKKRAQAEIDREKITAKINELEEIYRKATAEAESHGSELEQVREKGLVAASRVDGLSERLEILTRELKRVSDWLDNLEGRKEALENLTETLLQKTQELSQRIEELTEASKTLPEKIEKAEERLAQLRQEIEKVRERLHEKEEEAKFSRKTREELSKKLAALERELVDATHGLDKINHDLLKDWRVVFLDPYAPPPEPEAPEPEAPKTEAPKPPAQNEDEPNLNETGEDFEGQSAGEDSDDLDSEAGDQDEGLKTAAGPQNGQAEAAPEAAPAANPATEPATEPANQEGDRGDQGAEEPRITIAPPELVDPLGLADLELPNMAESNIVVLREKLAALGEVNLDAIREESEIKKTYDFYKTHYDDLVKAMRDLKTSISRINQTCRDRFSQTFELANRKFREIFPVLFEGGDGWLTLTDEFDPLESGVEIHVHPPGKKIMVMRSLSGGEKTLTSLCLIFALYLIKPSPFCLLDEADAPLDEANIDRFNKLLRNLAQASQIIMVTHNKRTMQIADMLYGVTMETPGVSKLVSVNLAEAEVLTHD